MDGKGEEEMTGKAWNFWRQKSPLLPRTPALGHRQAQGGEAQRGEAQDQTQKDAENKQKVRKMTRQVEGKLTNARMKVLEDIVDFKEVTVDDSSEEDDSKKQEDARGRVDLSGKIALARKMTDEMQPRTPRDIAVSRSTRIPNQDRSGGKVVKRSKGTPKIISKVRKLRKLFEPSPTRGPTEMLSQLS